MIFKDLMQHFELVIKKVLTPCYEIHCISAEVDKVGNSKELKTATHLLFIIMLLRRSIYLFKVATPQLYAEKYLN